MLSIVIIFRSAGIFSSLSFHYLTEKQAPEHNLIQKWQRIRTRKQSQLEEGSQSSDSKEEFQRLEEHVKAMERRIAQDREKRRNLFIRFMNLFLDLLEARVYSQNI
ncbi:uncharacterized protein LOC117147066 [Drosophila mauritiana]|uniref:Uncharacterized protein LOC117147066 n=1 Tax=Drosophila mauritiana TaxID=7226 RepID=A0A6P8L2U4_DROMA|nr:uncharacterized protein LOC117147066 [Drosophila mauritiana]